MAIRRTFLDAAAAVRPLLTDPHLAARWAEPSDLPEMTVGALAGHLSRAAITVAGYLDADPPAEECPSVDAAGYFVAIDGLGGTGVDLDSDLHRAIRDRSTRAAEGGPAAVLGQWDDAVANLTSRLAIEPDDRRIGALGGLAMTLDDYLVTRMVEITVHGDDLAVSLEVPSPVFATDAYLSVIGVLVDMARRTHGDLAVLRSLTRRRRDTVQALRVL